MALVAPLECQRHSVGNDRTIKPCRERRWLVSDLTPTGPKSSPLQPVGPKPHVLHTVVTGMTNDVRAAGALPTHQGALSTQQTLGVALTCWQEKGQDQMNLMVPPLTPLLQPRLATDTHLWRSPP